MFLHASNIAKGEHQLPTRSFSPFANTILLSYLKLSGCLAGFYCWTLFIKNQGFNVLVRCRTNAVLNASLPIIIKKE